MNEKSLNKHQLEELFTKHKDIPNINEIVFMGKISDGNAKNNIKNPNYSEFTLYNNGTKEKSFPTVKVTIDIPSPFRLDKKNTYFISKIPVFTSDIYVDGFKEVITDETEYIMGSGKLQNYQVLRKATPDSHLMNFLDDLMTRMGDRHPQSRMDVAKILNAFIEKKDNLKMALTNIWCNHIENANEIAKELLEQEKLPQINEVKLQGLVYMPPSIRRVQSEAKYSIHFKMRIKREKEDILIPDLYDADYDYINVVGFGEQCVEWFEKIKQGYPVLLTGRIETAKFKKAQRITPIQKEELSNFFGVDTENPYIKEIERYFFTHKIFINMPAFNVWADTIETNISKMQ